MILSTEPSRSMEAGAAGPVSIGPTFKRAFLGFVGSTSLLSTAMVLLGSL